jgi:hypothetical protein
MFRTAIISLFITSTAIATTWTVDDDGKADFNNIQAAVNAASNGDEIVVMRGTYTGTGNQVVDMLGKELWLHSSEGQGVTIIDGEETRRGILCENGETSNTIIEGFTIINGYRGGATLVEGGGAYISQSSPQFNDCTFESCTATNGYISYGGAIFCEDSSAIFNACTFYFNVAEGDWTGYGGAIATTGDPQSELALNSCLFITNVASDIGGGLMDLGAAGGAIYCTTSMSITECTFGIKMAGNLTKSDAKSVGGAIAFYGVENTSSVLAINNCDFSYNYLLPSDGGTDPEISEGAAIRVHNAGNTFITDSYFYKNWSIGWPDLGSIAVTGSPLIINGDVIIEYGSLDLIGPSSMLHLHSGSRLLGPSDVTLTEGGGVRFDIGIGNPNAESMIDLTTLDQPDAGSLFRYGGISVSGSLSGANLGDDILLAECILDGPGFDSVVLPSMTDGLGLELVEEYGSGSKGDDIIKVVVTEVEVIEFDNPVPEDLNGNPIDIITFDVDGDGRDEVAILYDGQPGSVIAYSVSANNPPIPIPGLSIDVGNDPVDIDAADVDNDGREDLVVANSTDNTISVLTSEVTGGDSYYFDQSILSAGSGNLLTSIACMQWDANGFADLAVGIDVITENVKDQFSVITDVGSSPASGPTFEIPKFTLPDDSDITDPPMDIDGTADGTMSGFIGGTQQGQVYRVSSLDAVQLVGDLNGNRITKVLLQELDADGGDGQIDLMVSSDEAEAIYLFQGNAAESDGFDDLIPLGVSVPVEDIIAIDADYDGDKDIVMTAPDSTISPLTVLRNEGATGGFVGSLTGITWSKQIMNSGNPPRKITGGGLNGKDEDDDWIVGGAAGAEGIRDEPVGTLEQTNLLGDINTCNPDINGDGYVNVSDLLAVIDQWGLTGSPADISGDGIVNETDLLEVVGNWGPCL